MREIDFWGVRVLQSVMKTVLFLISPSSTPQEFSTSFIYSILPHQWGTLIQFFLYLNVHFCKEELVSDCKTNPIICN